MSSSSTPLSHVLIILPSASSVSVSKPKTNVATYVLDLDKKKSKRRVAFPIVTGRTPSPKTSRVPKWPAFFAPTTFLTIPTTVLELSPAGLLTTIIPFTNPPKNYGFKSTRFISARHSETSFLNSFLKLPLRTQPPAFLWPPPPKIFVTLFTS